MKKRLLIGGMIVVLAIVVVTVVVTDDDADHYDYDVSSYAGMKIEVKKVDVFAIRVDDDTIVIVYSLNDGEGYLATPILKTEGVWQRGYYAIMPRVFTSTFLPDDEEFQLIRDEVIRSVRSIREVTPGSFSFRGAYPAQKGKVISAL